jgi:hypothetical protein
MRFTAAPTPNQLHPNSSANNLEIQAADNCNKKKPEVEDDDSPPVSDGDSNNTPTMTKAFVSEQQPVERKKETTEITTPMKSQIIMAVQEDSGMAAVIKELKNRVTALEALQLLKTDEKQDGFDCDGPTAQTSSPRRGSVESILLVVGGAAFGVLVAKKIC